MLHDPEVVKGSEPEAIEKLAREAGFSKEAATRMSGKQGPMSTEYSQGEQNSEQECRKTDKSVRRQW